MSESNSGIIKYRDVSLNNHCKYNYYIEAKKAKTKKASLEGEIKVWFCLYFYFFN